MLGRDVSPLLQRAVGVQSLERGLLADGEPLLVDELDSLLSGLVRRRSTACAAELPWGAQGLRKNLATGAWAGLEGEGVQGLLAKFGQGAAAAEAGTRVPPSQQAAPSAEAMAPEDPDKEALPRVVKRGSRASQSRVEVLVEQGEQVGERIKTLGLKMTSTLRRVKKLYDAGHIQLRLAYNLLNMGLEGLVVMQAPKSGLDGLGVLVVGEQVDVVSALEAAMKPSASALRALLKGDTLQVEAINMQASDLASVAVELAQTYMACPKYHQGVDVAVVVLMALDNSIASNLTSLLDQLEVLAALGELSSTRALMAAEVAAINPVGQLDDPLQEQHNYRQLTRFSFLNNARHKLQAFFEELRTKAPQRAAAQELLSQFSARTQRFAGQEGYEVDIEMSDALYHLFMEASPSQMALVVEKLLPAVMAAGPRMYKRGKHLGAPAELRSGWTPEAQAVARVLERALPLEVQLAKARLMQRLARTLTRRPPKVAEGAAAYEKVAQVTMDELVPKALLYVDVAQYTFLVNEESMKALESMRAAADECNAAVAKWPEADEQQEDTARTTGGTLPADVAARLEKKRAVEAARLQRLQQDREAAQAEAQAGLAGMRLGEEAPAAAAAGGAQPAFSASAIRHAATPEESDAKVQALWEAAVAGEEEAAAVLDHTEHFAV